MAGKKRAGVLHPCASFDRRLEEVSQLRRNIYENGKNQGIYEWDGHKWTRIYSCLRSEQLEWLLKKANPHQSRDNRGREVKKHGCNDHRADG